MGRPRRVSDEEVFGAAYRAMSRLGPGELRLTDIAEEAGLTASALVQRFGSKRELLLALSRAWSQSSGGLFTQLRAQHRSPLAVVRAYAACLAGLAQSPEAFARSLAYLFVDLTDEDFRVNLEAYARATRAEIERLLSAAVEVGELAQETDAPALARTVEAIISGSMMTWAHYREGPARPWILGDLEAVLGPHLAR